MVIKKKDPKPIFSIQESIKKFFYSFYVVKNKMKKVIIMFMILFIIVNISKAYVGYSLSGSTIALFSFGIHFLGMISSYFLFRDESMNVVFISIFTLNLLFFVGVESYLQAGGSSDIIEILTFVFSSADCSGESVIDAEKVVPSPPDTLIPVSTANPSLLNTALSISGSASVAFNSFLGIPGLLNRGVDVGSSLSDDAKNGIVVMSEAVDVGRETLAVAKDISSQLKIITRTGVPEMFWGIGSLFSATIMSRTYAQLSKFTLKNPIAFATKAGLGAGTISVLGSSMVYLTIGTTKVFTNAIPFIFNPKDSAVFKINEQPGKIDVPGVNLINPTLLPKPLQIEGIPSQDVTEEISVIQNPLHKDTSLDIRDEFVDGFLENGGEMIDFLIGNIY